MAIVSCKETFERSGGVDRSYARVYRRKFRVVTDSTATGAKAVALAPGIAIGFAYVTATESDPASYCVGVNATCTDRDGKGWAVDVDYGPYDPNENEDPFQQPLDVSWGWSTFEEIVDQDVNGNAVVNSAYDPFDPPVTRDRNDPVLTITRNEASFSMALAYPFKDAVNGATFLGQPPYTIKCADISPQRLWSPFHNAYYWRVTYQFAFNSKTWRKVVLNQGLYQLVGGAKHQIVIDGAPATDPKLLDANGALLAPGGQPTWVTYSVYPELNFAVFNFTLAQISMS